MVAINKDARQMEAQVLAGRGGVREIGAILCDVLAQYGLDRSRTGLLGPATATKVLTGANGGNRVG